MINSLLYYTLNMSMQNLSPRLETESLDLLYTLNRGHLAIISDRTYNMDISLPLNYQSPRSIISVESTSSRILGFPLFVRLFYKTCIQKVFNQKNTRLYFKHYYNNMQIFIIFTKEFKKVFGIVNYNL